MHCICRLKTGARAGQECGAPAKNGQFCGRHTKCTTLGQKSPTKLVSPAIPKKKSPRMVPVIPKKTKRKSPSPAVSARAIQQLHAQLVPKKAPSPAVSARAIQQLHAQLVPKYSPSAGQFSPVKSVPHEYSPTAPLRTSQKLVLPQSAKHLIKRYLQQRIQDLDYFSVPYVLEHSKFLKQYDARFHKLGQNFTAKLMCKMRQERVENEQQKWCRAIQDY